MSKTKTKAQVEAKTSKQAMVCCMTCLHSLLHRYDNNPVLAACQKKPNMTGLNAERFPFEVDVAITMKRCELYDHEAGNKVIELRKKAV